MLSDVEKDALLAAMTATFSRSGSVPLVPTNDNERWSLQIRIREVSAVIGVRMSMTKQASDFLVLRDARRLLDRWIEDDSEAERRSSGVAPG